MSRFADSNEATLDQFLIHKEALTLTRSDESPETYIDFHKDYSVDINAVRTCTAGITLAARIKGIRTRTTAHLKLNASSIVRTAANGFNRPLISSLVGKNTDD